MAEPNQAAGAIPEQGSPPPAVDSSAITHTEQPGATAASAGSVAADTGGASTGTQPTTPATPTAPASPGWLSQLREAGVPFQGDDEKAAIAALANVYKQFAQLQPLVPYVSAYTQHAPQFAKWMEQQRGGQQQPAPATPQGDKPW